ncbi:MAG: FAD:protein FMN transferase [Sulfitobacter sp.]
MRATDLGRKGPQAGAGSTMSLTRRRFISIAAASAALPGSAHAHSWQGHAFGAQVSLTLRGSKEQAARALKEARGLILQMEHLFSLYDPASALVELNKTAILRKPDAHFLALMQASDLAYTQTRGLFDPTVQPLWMAHASGQDPSKGYRAVGWDRVRFAPEQITLDTDQALTFNGIAQGYATDVVTNALAARGFTGALVNIGELRGMGGLWTIGIKDPVHGILGTRQLNNEAIATSSPAATSIGEQGHILHPNARPKWSSVSVQAPSATMADSISTAMVLADRPHIEQIKMQTGISHVILIDFDGNLSSL